MNQTVDALKALYVALTRAVLGMHIIAKTPSAKCLKGDFSSFADFSQILYWYVSDYSKDFLQTQEDGTMRFDLGEMPEFDRYRDEEEPLLTFEVPQGEEYPSYSLNPELVTDDGEVLDVCERGRLRFSADAVDFFSSDGQSGVSASNRIRGVVLHDILSRVAVSDDLHKAVRQSVMEGELSESEAAQVLSLLSERLASVSDYGWFDAVGAEILNETSLIDTDGEICRPDRVVIKDGKAIIIDYKFGEHRRSYERQLMKYADIWRRMGYDEVSSYLWSVQTGEVVKVG